jgi:hypothetical protein
LKVLPFYLVYRALVRAKVADIRLHQHGLTDSEARRERRELAGYLGLAEAYTHRPPPRLLITHGPSGSGKTFGAQSLVDALGAVRIRSDVERQRLRARQPTSCEPAVVAQDLYTPQATEQTYARLAELAETVLQAGFTVVVDATFLERRQRDAFRALADALGVPFGLLDFHAARSTLERRVRHRGGRQRDASEATVEVLARQLEEFQPLGIDEAEFAVVVDTEACGSVNELAQRLGPGLRVEG